MDQTRSLASKTLSTEPGSRSKQFLLDPSRGLYVPSHVSDFDEATGVDRHGRPQRINLQTVSEYFTQDILAFDRFAQPESTRKMPLYAHQRIMAKELMMRQFLYVQMMRGGAKSSTFGRLFLDLGMMEAGQKIILTAPTFRQALMVFDEIVTLINLNALQKNSPFDIRAEIKGDIRRGNIESIIQFRNGSLIKAVPMGDGSKIRGLRGGILFVDEAYQISEEMYESHLRPFVGVKQGDRPSKIIMTTTSWYQDCFMYRRVLQMASAIKSGDPDYGILDFTLDDLKVCSTCQHSSEHHAKGGGVCKLCNCEKHNGFPLDPKIFKDARNFGNPMIYLMTYYNIWPSSQIKWYEQKAIDDGLSVRHGVRVEMRRPKGDPNPYFLVVDLAASDKGDNYVVLVAKMVDKQARYVYGIKAKGLGGHERAWRCREVIERFDPAFVIYDAHAAIGKDFRTDMARDTLVTNFDGVTEVHANLQPIIHLDGQEDRGKRGTRLLIPVNTKSEPVVVALTGTKEGSIDGEDGLSALLHTKARDLLWNDRMVGPAMSATREESLSEDEALVTSYSGSELEAAEVVRLAFNQLATIQLDKDPNTQEQRTTKSGQQVFKKPSGTAKDDGAMCLAYGTIGILRLEGFDGSQTPRPRGQSSAMTTRPQLAVPNSREGVCSVQLLSFS